MAAQLPNIKKLFIPDPGYTIFDVDEAGADAQVVAWRANAEELKAAFRAGLDVHAFNAERMFGTKFSTLSLDDPKRGKIRKQTKQAVHGTNYGASARTLAMILGWTVMEAEGFQQRWFSANPGIRQWHRDIDLALRTTRSVTNAFGYKITYFDRIDTVFPQALAWEPQSTVAIVAFKAALAIRRHMLSTKLLAQVHDSLVGQFPTPQRAKVLPELRRHLNIVIPFPDPLIIPWGLATSTKSWGDVQKEKWPEAA